MKKGMIIQIQSACGQCYEESFQFNPTGFLRDGDEDGALPQSKDSQECRGACMKYNQYLSPIETLFGRVTKQRTGGHDFAWLLMAVLKMMMMHSPEKGMASRCF